jgi:hypothetical protein
MHNAECSMKRQCNSAMCIEHRALRFNRSGLSAPLGVIVPVTAVSGGATTATAAALLVWIRQAGLSRPNRATAIIKIDSAQNEDTTWCGRIATERPD